MRAEGYDQLGEDEKDVLACGNCFNDITRKQLPRYAYVSALFLPASTKFAPVERDRGVSHGRLTAVSVDLRNNLVCWSEKICWASNQCAGRAEIVVKSLPHKLSDDLVLNVCIKKYIFHKSGSFCNLVNVSSLRKWMAYLAKSPLYEWWHIRVDPKLYDLFDTMEIYMESSHGEQLPILIRKRRSLRQHKGPSKSQIDGIDSALCERYVNKTNKGGDGSTPSLVGLRGLAIAKLPVTFVPTVIKIKDNVIVKGHWKDLLHRRYFYGFLDISLIGFKIVKNDLDKHCCIILDLNVDKVIYREYLKMLSYPSNVESGKKYYIDFDLEDFSSSLHKKKKKKLNRSWVSKSREFFFCRHFT